MLVTLKKKKKESYRKKVILTGNESTRVYIIYLPIIYCLWQPVDYLYRTYELITIYIISLLVIDSGVYQIILLDFVLQ